MAPCNRIFSALGLLAVAQGARTKRHGASSRASVAGIPISNYRADAEDFIVLFKPGTDDAAIDAFCQGRCSLKGNPSSGGVAFAQIHGYEEMAMVANDRPDIIDLVETDAEVYMIPELDVSDSTSAKSWGLDSVGAPGRAVTGKGVHIFVQDTGIRVSHEDFAGRARPGHDASQSRDCEEDDLTCAADKQGHGTHCAGTAGGKDFGVAPEAHVWAVKTLGDNGGGTMGWQLAGVNWAAGRPERPGVMSLSLGGNGVVQSFKTAIDGAVRSGLTVVVAAGNSNADSCGFSPAFVPSAITVGATDSVDKRATYSNYGRCNNIFAPGSAITSAGIGSNTDSKTFSGTSMACPHVSGGVALLLEQDSSLQPEAVLEKLKNNAIKDKISSLMESDPTEFLWVSAEAPPESGTTLPAIPIPECRRRIWCR